MKNETKKTKAVKATKAPKEAKSIGLKATVYSKDGKSKGSLDLSEKAFGLPWNADLVAQVVHSMMSTARDPIAHTKTRGEVRGGGKKPWRQKGTGRARHGSTRSPIWVGGGIAHGPRNDKNYGRKVNKTMKGKAFLTVLSKKFRDGEIVFVDSLSISAPKTAEAVQTLQNLSKVEGFAKLSTKVKNAAVLALAKKDANVEKSFRNIGSVDVSEARNLNILDLLNHTFVVIENPSETLKAIEAKL